MANFKKVYAVIAIMTIMILPVTAQNLTANQMNIYFGLPKMVTMTNSQGTTITEFDRNRCITKVKQGNMSINYEWSEDSTDVTLSMYQGANYQDHSHVKIIENTLSKLRYDMGGIVTVDVTFKDNGALDKVVMTNPQFSGTITYFYDKKSDVYPSAVEQSSGNQSAKGSVTINETDSYGNAVVYTQEFMGNKDVTRLAIEYY